MKMDAALTRKSGVRAEGRRKYELSQGVGAVLSILGRLVPGIARNAPNIGVHTRRQARIP
ncbi:hypothetical protein EAS56_22025 [Bradyrhizobium guangzhouense]|uniref:Uncharacterized protein n=1 Tax=Bradyrhizobium guangzhouense TaxID=1325095 RepID=A0AAE5X3W0_9BRAD|nr:hypothetical protein XH91_24175 [Bradyrhizobium guangzhouense]RXH10733.1 hypothetical protein EAS56_22025 [Bradyrhizobium guangzhouense]